LGRASTTCLAVTAVTIALALTGCGRKGPLDPPASVPQTETPAQAEATQARVLQTPDENPGRIRSPDTVYEESAIAKLNSETKNPARPINAPPLQQPNSFFLDPLIK
jgi:predicted small lipoprotein YifL